MPRTRYPIAAMAGLAALAFASTALAAGYLKLGDIKGESTEAKDHKDWIEIQSFSWGTSQTGAASRQGSLTLSSGQDPVAIGLLLPAVQKVRDAAARSRSAPVVTYREVVAGRVVKTYWLKNATLSQAANGAVKVAYECKTWRDERTKKKASDCARQRKGNVEYQWKVEEGES